MAGCSVAVSFLQNISETSAVIYVHECNEEQKSSAIGKPLQEKHNAKISELAGKFSILKRCKGKPHFLSYQMLNLLVPKYLICLTFFNFFVINPQLQLFILINNYFTKLPLP